MVLICRQPFWNASRRKSEMSEIGQNEAGEMKTEQMEKLESNPIEYQQSC